MRTIYRKLKPHETVRESDEYTWNESYSIQARAGSFGWIKCLGDVIGQRVRDTSVGGQFRRAVKLPAKKPKAKTATRRESRVSRIATVIQRVKTGELPSAQEGAKLVERIYDNSQRAKRRKEGK